MSPYFETTTPSHGGFYHESETVYLSATWDLYNWALPISLRINRVDFGFAARLLCLHVDFDYYPEGILADAEPEELEWLPLDDIM